MHQELFNVTDKLRIYQTGGSNKTKYFDSAVSAFLNSASLEDKPQILQTHGWQTGLTARFLREREGNTDIKIINTIHVGNIDCGGPKPREFYSGTGLISARTVYGALDSLNYSDKSVTVSSGLIEDLTSLKGLHPDIAFVYTCNKHKLFPILNGIDHRKYDPRSIPTFDPANPKASKEVIRKELFARGGDIVGTRSAWSMAPDLPVILFVGRFSPEKGTAEFAEAARICQGKANLVFMGRGLDAEMNELIKTPSNNVLVVLTERDQQLLGPRLRACADIQFVPSYSEACGLVAMEGQATGALTVASNIGGLPDIVKDLRVSADGGTGFLYEPGDSGSLAEALENAVRMINSSDAESIVSRVYLDSREYDWQVTSRKYSSLYGSLVELAPLMMTPVDSSTRVSELPSSRRLDI
jgi:glycogen synthase